MGFLKYKFTYTLHGKISIYFCVLLSCVGFKGVFEVESCAHTWHLRIQKVKGNEWVWKVMERWGEEQGGESKNVILIFSKSLSPTKQVQVSNAKLSLKGGALA